MKLLMSPFSPYARKLRIMIRETGQLDEIEEVAVATSAIDTDAGLARANPLARIPVLFRADGRPLYDSRVISRYLDEIGACGLYPAARLWDVLLLEAEAEGILDSAVGMAYEVRLRPGDKQWTGWLDAQWAKISRTLDHLDAQVPAGPVDMGQIGLGAALGYLDFRHAARDWRTGRPALAAWLGEFEKRPSMAATRPQA